MSGAYNPSFKKKKTSVSSGSENSEEQLPKIKTKKKFSFTKVETKKKSKSIENEKIKIETKTDLCNENLDHQFAQQIKMTDDYKMITKLQEQINKYENIISQIRSDYETAQANLESVRLDLAIEKQKSMKFQEELEKGI